MTRRRLDPRVTWALLLVAAVIVAVAMAGGGYSNVALGGLTLIVWIALVAGLLCGRIGGVGASGPLVVGAACLLALLALTALSLGWTASDEAAFAETVRIAGYLGAFLLAGLTARSSRTGAVVGGVAIAAVAVALIALGSRLLGIGEGDASLVAAIPNTAGRLSYPVGYWNALGALVVMALPALCWLATDVRSRGACAAAFVGFVPPLLAAYMTSSRGALIAAAVGLLVVVGFASDRRRSAAAATIGVAAALPAIAAATLAPGIVDSVGDGSAGKSELVVIVAMVGGMALAAFAGPRLLNPLSGARFFDFRIPMRTVLPAVAAVAAVVIVLAGPSALVGDLRAGAEGNQSDRTVGIVSASGSGRTQFWGAALGAFATEPIRGIGAGGYALYWNQNGSLKTPARNAHSEPLELLAELGIFGAACFFGFLAVVISCGVRRARKDGPGSAAALGILAAALVGFTIDWTWQMPAVVLPFLIVAGTLAGNTRSRGAYLPTQALPRLSTPAMALCVIALAIPATWAAGTLAVASSRLDASADAFAQGHLDEAAASARSAAAIQPWAAEPWLRLAEIEQAGDNLPAAQTAVRAAIARGPEDVRSWILATTLQIQLHNRDATTAYAVRSVALGPSD